MKWILFIIAISPWGEQEVQVKEYRFDTLPQCAYAAVRIEESPLIEALKAASKTKLTLVCLPESYDAN